MCRQSAHFKAGEVGYLLKILLRTELVETIRPIYSGQKRIPREIADVIAEQSQTMTSVHQSPSSSWSRERQFEEDHCIESRDSEHTAKNHIKSILSKRDANDRTHAVTIAMRRGFLDLQNQKVASAKPFALWTSFPPVRQKNQSTTYLLDATLREFAIAGNK